MVFCGTLNTGPKLAASCTSGKSSAAKDCSVNLLLPPLRISFGGARSDRDGLIGGHGAQDIDELASAYGGGEISGIAAEFGSGADLDFKIAGGELQ